MGPGERASDAEESEVMSSTVRDAVRRLTPEFGGALGAATVRTVVVEARRQLDGLPAADLPELVERLARQRLHEVAGRRR